MAEYTKVFDNPYPDGWKDLPSEETPITASALQEHTDAIENIENYLEENPIGGGSTSYFGTSAEFEEFKKRTDIPDGTEYIVTDDYDGDILAESIKYDNSKTSIVAENVQDAIDEVFQSVSNGKELVASAISDKGVPTLATDTFSIMANNISQISSGGGNANVLFNALEITSAINNLQASYTPTKDAKVIVIYHVNVGSNDNSSAIISGLDNAVVLSSRGTTQAQGFYCVWLGDIKNGQTLTCKWSLNTGSYRRACMTVIEI